MKVLHLSTGDNKGAYLAAYRFHKNLMNNNYESKMFVAEKTIEDPNILTISKSTQFFRKFFLRFNRIFLQYSINTSEQKKRYFLFDYPHINVNSLFNQLPKQNFDLIIVYYTSNFISIEQIRKISEYYNSKVAFYLMDMALMTGGCHYAWECDQYYKDCANCPNVNNYIMKYFIKNSFYQKSIILKELSPHIFYGSSYLENQIIKSNLLKTFTSSLMFIGLDPSIYSPMHRNDTRSKLAFSDKDIIIYFGAQSINDPRKGFNYLLDALDILYKENDSSAFEHLILLTIGNHNDLNFPIGLKHIHLSYISDEFEFAKIYSAADIYISSSIEDSGPMMVNESILSGTPVIAFSIGVALDIVETNITGYLCSLKNTNELAERLLQFIKLPSLEKEIMRKSCRQIGLEKTSLHAQFKSFKEKYNVYNT